MTIKKLNERIIDLRESKDLTQTELAKRLSIDKSAMNKIESGTRKVSADELSSWSSEDLAKLRNEIFARHGRIFKTQKWIDYFATKTWYVPRYDNVDSMLNDYEWANLDVILKLEDQRS